MKLKPLVKTIMILSMITLIEWLLLGPFCNKFDLFGPAYSSYVMNALLALLLVIVACKLDGIRFRDIGWKKPLSFVKGSLLGLLFVSAIIGIAWVSGIIRLSGIVPNGSQWLYLFIIFTLVAATEELFYRGMIVRLLLDKLPRSWVVLVSSLIFVVSHFFNPYVKPDVIGAINLFMGGCFLPLLYLWSRSLWLPIGFHLAWNWTQEVALEWFASESMWVKNSFFGLEGWPVTVAFWIVVMSISLWLLKKRGDLGSCLPRQFGGTDAIQALPRPDQTSTITGR